MPSFFKICPFHEDKKFRIAGGHQVWYNLGGKTGIHFRSPMQEVTKMNATACSFTASRAVRFFAAIAAACAALGASAATYYWKPDGDNYRSWGSKSSWSTESETGADADTCPSGTDVLACPSGAADVYAKLDGEYSLASTDENGHRKFYFMRDESIALEATAKLTFSTLFGATK